METGKIIRIDNLDELLQKAGVIKPGDVVRSAHNPENSYRAEFINSISR